MSVKRRSFIYDNGKNEPWKIVDADSYDAQLFNAKKNQPYFSADSFQDKRQQFNPCNRCDEPRKLNNLCTIVSVKNPLSELIIPISPAVSFNALPAAIVGETVDLVGWTDIVTDALDAFDNLTGTYTAQESGDYPIDLVVNYETSVPLALDPTMTTVPSIEVYDVATGNSILASAFPTINIIVPVPPQSSGESGVLVPVASVIAKSQVIISAIIPLVVGQRIRVRALTNGLLYLPPLEPISIAAVIPPLPARIIFNPTGADTTLSIYKIRNSPIVTINCNN